MVIVGMFSTRTPEPEPPESTHDIHRENKPVIEGHGSESARYFPISIRRDEVATAINIKRQQQAAIANKGTVRLWAEW